MLTLEDIPRIKRFTRSKQRSNMIGFLDRISGEIGLTDKCVNDVMPAWANDDNDFWMKRLAY